MKKKGVLGLDIAKSFVLAILTLAIIAFAVVIAMNELNDSSVSTAQTTSIFNNVSNGVADFFSNAGSWFALLAVVIIILIVSVVIVVVNKFGRNTGV